jgi:chemotaxis protein methyltransferase CheR
VIAERSSSPDGIPATTTPGLAELELQLLFDGVQRLTGFDFREYAPATVKRRIAERVRAEAVTTTTGLLERILHEPAAMARLIDALTRNAGSPFREPSFFETFRDRVVPRLRTFPHVRIWVIGSGDDAFSLAILLREAELGGRSRIYATDVSDAAVERAKSGTFPVELFEEYTQRYAESGGTRQLGDYVDLAAGLATYKPFLREHLVFAQHNLATDGSFNEFHLIVARNVFGHYTRSLAYRAHQVVFESLIRLGYLGLGARESLRYTPHQRAYEPIDETESFYKRVR